VNGAAKVHVNFGAELLTSILRKAGGDWDEYAPELTSPLYTVLAKPLDGKNYFWFALAKPARPFAALRACPFCWLKQTLGLV
jgi:hypothetical protein